MPKSFFKLSTSVPLSVYDLVVIRNHVSVLHRFRDTITMFM